MLARDDLFDGVPQWEVTMGGHRFPVPTFYRDASCLEAIFAAKERVVAAWLPTPELRPLTVVPGVAAVALHFFDYRDTDLGPYREVSIGVPALLRARSVPLASVAKPFRRRVFTAWIHHLPVTTELARAVGVEAHGYPKFVADIEFDATDHRFRGALNHEGRRVFGLSGELPVHEQTDVPLRWVTYQMRNGRLVETTVLVRADTRAVRYSRNHLHLDLDDEHPIAAELGEALIGRHPIYVEWLGSMRSILHPPTVVS